ncbi:Os01g0325875 [Oryza sativa Japonica Group]|uniref:Os01g0325875 protein n=1 Tax=Oryza sativa subsp. japonica TaxID=39947 RepID=A0A0P0V1V9_ORYSJ|nr:Os01g0325875 [Oryza sativa Japonica Group]
MLGGYDKRSGGGVGNNGFGLGGACQPPCLLHLRAVELVLATTDLDLDELVGLSVPLTGPPYLLPLHTHSRASPPPSWTTPVLPLRALFGLPVPSPAYSFHSSASPRPPSP